LWETFLRWWYKGKFNYFLVENGTQNEFGAGWFILLSTLENITCSITLRAAAAFFSPQLT
jgi:hypothetical protein